MSDNAKETAFPEGMRMCKAKRLAGRVARVLGTTEPQDFVTRAQDNLRLDLEGIPGDRHGGYTRRSGGREPWYPRGTSMCNERQISVLSVEELALIADRMELAEIKPEWIGGNIVLEGLPHLSLIPPRTRLVFEGGAVIRIDGDNDPCRAAGSSIARHVPGREGLDLLFPRKAKHLRGLVGFVEKAGTINSSETVTAHIPAHWIYDPV